MVITCLLMGVKIAVTFNSCHIHPMGENWIERWENGRTGWHEPEGNAGLKAHWPGDRAGNRVLVPLCGKSPDLLWLADLGHEVVGVELSEIAVRAFFEDNDLTYEREPAGGLVAFRASGIPVTIYQGDYFELEIESCDALYDRGALVALPATVRPDYVAHTKRLIRSNGMILLVTLEYEQSVVSGPPYSVLPAEVNRYWPHLKRLEQKDDFETCPPKFRQAGLTEIYEVVWRSPPSGP